MEKPRYRIEYLLEIENYLKKFPRNIRERIKKAIENRLGDFPKDVGKPLTKEWKDHRRLRVGDFRIIYKVFEERVVVLIVEIDHRKNIYE
ncbi:MAG: type II toxin-antitoxin system RelE/ParE family toxin [Chloroherpetonaceae bacterium]